MAIRRSDQMKRLKLVIRARLGPVVSVESKGVLGVD
jgi:hypothetical protein